MLFLGLKLKQVRNIVVFLICWFWFYSRLVKTSSVTCGKRECICSARYPANSMLYTIVYWRCFPIVLICCVTKSYLRGHLITPLNEIQMDVKHTYKVLIFSICMFRFFNLNWLIADEIELASRFVGVIPVTLQIIPSKKNPEV